MAAPVSNSINMFLLFSSKSIRIGGVDLLRKVNNVKSSEESELSSIDILTHFVVFLLPLVLKVENCLRVSSLFFPRQAGEKCPLFPRMTYCIFKLTVGWGVVFPPTTITRLRVNSLYISLH